MHPISAIIIINPDWFGALETLPQALASLNFCNQIIIATSHKTTLLTKIANKYNATQIIQQGQDFSAWRFHAISQAKNNWVIFLDADEVITSKLQQEVVTLISSIDCSAYAFPRLNYIFNKPFYHGGWWPDYVIRLINKNYLISYQGQVHEQPQIKGSLGYTQNHLIHNKHANLDDMVAKTLVWSTTESKLLFNSNHPPMYIYRFIRPFFSELISRLFVKRGFKDGSEGLIDAIYQGYSRLITYIKLYELQQTSKK